MFILSLTAWHIIGDSQRLVEMHRFSAAKILLEIPSLFSYLKQTLSDMRF